MDSNPRHLYLHGVIDHESVGKIQERLLSMDLDSHEPIYFYICSDGGNVSPAVGLYDLLRYIEAPIITIAQGTAGSAAALLFMAGDLRLMSKNGAIFFHPPITEVEIDSLQKVRGIVKEYEYDWNLLKRVILERSDTSEEEWDRIFADNTWHHLTAEEATSYGVATGVLDYDNKYNKLLALEEVEHGVKRKRSPNQRGKFRKRVSKKAKRRSRDQR